MTTEERLRWLENVLAHLLRDIEAAVRKARTSLDDTKSLGRDPRIQDPDHPEDLAFTRIDQGRFGSEFANKWNGLVQAGIRAAVKKHYGISVFRRCGDLPVREGKKTDEGYSPVQGTNLSVRGMSTNDAWRNTLALARSLKYEIRVDFHWRDKDRAANPNEAGRLFWSPETEAGGRSPIPLQPGRPGPSAWKRQGRNPQGPR